MEKIAVIAHNKKVLGKGLAELRRNLADRGYPDPLWSEVDKSRKATKWARQAVKDNVDLLFAWGGDGTVQRCIEAIAGTSVTLAILPAGLALNFGRPSSTRTRATTTSSFAASSTRWPGPTRTGCG